MRRRTASVSPLRQAAERADLECLMEATAREGRWRRRVLTDIFGLMLQRFLQRLLGGSEGKNDGECWGGVAVVGIVV
jgi:hypothetical protein